MLAAVPLAARADVEITLQNSFIEKYKDRATIDASLTVDRARPQADTQARDGDAAASGRPAEIGLPTVIEIMNVAVQPGAGALDLIRQAEQSGRPLAVRGVWRLWCEHGGDSQQVQGQPLPPLDSIDPPHVFEIHPLLKVADQDLAASFQPVEELTYRDADEAFQHFETLASRVTTGARTTTITTRMAGFDYVEFVIQLAEAPDHLLADGLAVRAAILNTQGALLVRERRMVAVAGTAPYLRLKALHKGDTLHVVGIPRIDLSLLSQRIASAAQTAGILDWSLPYEMVLVAAFGDTSAAAGDSPPVTATPAVPAPASATMPATAAQGAPPHPVTPATPIAPDGDVVVILAQLLSQSLAPDVARGACIFSTGTRSYCAALSGPQCDQLGGAWNSGEDCPPPPLIAAAVPAASPATLATGSVRSTAAAPTASTASTAASPGASPPATTPPSGPPAATPPPSGPPSG
jgi:hypothetical protein